MMHDTRSPGRKSCSVLPSTVLVPVLALNVCTCVNSSMWIYTCLLHTCKHSQTSTAGYPGMQNLMPEAQNERKTVCTQRNAKPPVHKKHKTTRAVLAMFTSAK